MLRYCMGTHSEAQTPISPYSFDYVQGAYVLYFLLKPVSTHATFAAAERAACELESRAFYG